MPNAAAWPRACPLASERLVLEPLRPEHADEMAPLLDDAALHTFIGGAPLARERLRARYERQAAGQSPDGAEGWLNWVARRRDTGEAVGTVQATLAERGGTLVARVAWVIASAQQRRGYAREAAAAMIAWLRGAGASVFVAHIHPRHLASMAVARALGLAPTPTRVDGEVRWQG